MKFVVRWWRKAPEWLGMFLALMAGFWVVFAVRLDPDFGWHLRSGWYILQHGIPAHDIYTYTATTFPWINHEWLSDVLIALVYSLGGFGLVTALCAAIWAAACVLAAPRGRWPVAALGFMALASIVTARPNVWTALGFGLTLALLRSGRQWVLVPVFVVWANLHGGFVLGLLVVALAAVRRVEYRWVWVACCLATLINPYGANVYVEIWRTLGDVHLHSTVREWQPLGVDGLNGLYIVVFLVVGVMVRWRRATWLPLAMLVAAVASVRHFPLFVLASLGIINVQYGVALRLLRERRWVRWALPAGAALGAVVAIGLIARSPDVRAPHMQVAQLRERPCEGQIFNDYDFGGYLIWQLPEKKVYIDGRMPSWKFEGKDYMSDWMADLEGGVAAQRDFARYDIGCALLQPRHRKLIAMLEREGWTVSARDAQAVLLRRPGRR